MIDRTHDPKLRSWVESANHPGTDFPIQNLPYCTFRRTGEERARAGVAIGDSLLDLVAFGIDSLTEVLSMTHAERTALRARISGFLTTRSPGADAFLSAMTHAELLLPCPIGDYTDFYASIHHATNVGSMFRPDNPLLPNYKWLPVAYHGRASSIVVSGTPIVRPCGQTVESPSGPPAFGPSRRLDYELELGAFLGPGNPLGRPISAADAAQHIAGVCLLN